MSDYIYSTAEMILCSGLAGARELLNLRDARSGPPTPGESVAIQTLFDVFEEPSSVNLPHTLAVADAILCAAHNVAVKLHDDCDITATDLLDFTLAGALIDADRYRLREALELYVWEDVPD